MKAIPAAVLLRTTLIATLLCSTFGLSVVNPDPRQFIDIVNPLQKNGIEERLPASLIQNWPTWTWSPTTNEWKKIQGQDDLKGFVNPFSVDYLWQPVDLNPPECTLALAIHCRNGIPRHIFPAIDVSYGGEGRDRNRGLHTSPRAWKWFDFTSYVAGTRQCRLELRTFDSSTGKESSVDKLQTIHGVDKLVDSILQALSENPPTEVGDGSVIVQATTTASTSFALPKQNQILSAALVEDDRTLIGSLDVMVQSASAGSLSEYLPDAYRPLFHRELRPEYQQFQQRKTDRYQ